MRIPFLSNRESALPFRRIIERTANEMALSDHLVALVASHLFQGVIREVSMGQAVAIPPFGMFAPISWSSPTGKYPTQSTPRFCPSRAFKNEVASSGTPFPRAEEKFVNYRRNHHRSGNPETKAARKDSRGFTASLAFRQQIEAQARKIGLDPYDPGS